MEPIRVYKCSGVVRRLDLPDLSVVPVRRQLGWGREVFRVLVLAV
jgi:hypothetical protein